MDADEFDGWLLWDRFFPLDDQSNFHVPIAALHAATMNVHRAQGAAPLRMMDCLHFRGLVPADTELGEVEGW